MQRPMVQGARRWLLFKQGGGDDTLRQQALELAAICRSLLARDGVEENRQARTSLTPVFVIVRLRSQVIDAKEYQAHLSSALVRGNALKSAT